MTHIRLLVDDYKACFLFYRDVLGFTVGWGDENSLYGDFLVNNHFKLAIFERKQMLQAIGEVPIESSKKQEQVMLIFRVENVDQFYSSWQEKVDFVTAPMNRSDWGIRVAHFRDPEGNLIEINEYIGMENK